MGALAYGGSARCYRAEMGRLAVRTEEAADRNLPFSGDSVLGRTVTKVGAMADALQTLQSEAAGGRAYVAYVVVDPAGTGWVREVCMTVLGEAVHQMILPFRVLSTSDETAASFLRDSLTPAD